MINMTKQRQTDTQHHQQTLSPSFSHWETCIISVWRTTIHDMTGRRKRILIWRGVYVAGLVFNLSLSCFWFDVVAWFSRCGLWLIDVHLGVILVSVIQVCYVYVVQFHRSCVLCFFRTTDPLSTTCEDCALCKLNQVLIASWIAKATLTHLQKT